MVRSAKNKQNRVHTGACAIDVETGAGWGLKRGQKEAGQMARAFIIQNNHAEEFVWVPEWKFLFFSLLGRTDNDLRGKKKSNRCCVFFLNPTSQQKI